MARELESSPPRGPRSLVLQFHDAAATAGVTAAGCVSRQRDLPVRRHVGLEPSADRRSAARHVNLWIVAAFAGALTALFTALSFTRSFSVRFDTEGMMSRISGTRWQHLRVARCAGRNIRSLQERDRIACSKCARPAAKCSRLPMKVVNYRDPQASPRQHGDVVRRAAGEIGRETAAIDQARDTIITPTMAMAPPISIDESSCSPSTNTLMATPNTGTRLLKMLVTAVPHFLTDM